MAQLEDALIDLIVTHAGQTHPFTLPVSASLERLRSLIEAATSVPTSNQKIVYKGKALQSADGTATLASLHLPNPAKLLLIGSRATSVSSLVLEGLALQKRLDATRKREGVQPRKTASAGKMVMDLNDLRRSGAGAFGSIEVLPDCPHEDIRKERLVRLSKDEAVLGESMAYDTKNRRLTRRLAPECMKQREWTVGVLSELHPHRDPTLLGLNKNAGEAILLRIMTDDLTGLRSVGCDAAFLMISHSRPFRFLSVFAYADGASSRADP